MVFALFVVSASNAGSPASAASAIDVSASAELAWSSEQAIAALTATTVVTLPGSPAVIDEQRLTQAIGTSSIKILAVPFAQPEKPTDSRMDEATSDELQAVRSWALDRDIDLITVVGLHISLGGILEQRPDSIPDLQRTMLRSDLTPSLLFSVAYEQSGQDAADEVSETTETTTVEVAVPADPATTETIAAVLAQDKYYAAAGVDAPEGAFGDWQRVVGPDRVVRVALLPAPAAGEPLVDQLGPLAARFPDDIVVVATGRWVQMAGPEQNLLDSAVLYGYGAFYDRIVQNDLPLANLVIGMLRRVGDLRGGTVSDQAGPTTDDPVSGVTPLLPWLFAGTAVLVLAALLLVRRRRSAAELSLPAPSAGSGRGRWRSSRRSPNSCCSWTGWLFTVGPASWSPAPPSGTGWPVTCYCATAISTWRGMRWVRRRSSSLTRRPSCRCRSADPAIPWNRPTPTRPRVLIADDREEQESERRQTSPQARQARRETDPGDDERLGTALQAHRLGLVVPPLCGAGDHRDRGDRRRRGALAAGVAVVLTGQADREHPVPGQRLG